MRDPVTEELCRDQQSISNTATDFYTKLFTPSSDSTSLSILIRSIPQHLKNLSDQQKELIMSIAIEKLLEENKCTPRKSSPGPDGIPYEILYLVLRFLPYHALITEIYNSALQRGKFPKSWNESVMCLLYKKGDQAEMKIIVLCPWPIRIINFSLVSSIVVLWKYLPTSSVVIN